MKKRVHLNLSNYLNDLELIEPQLFQEDFPSTGKSLPINSNQFTISELKSPRKLTLKKNHDPPLKRTSLEKAPLDEYSQSAKEKLQGQQLSEMGERIETNSITRITSTLPTNLRTQRTRLQTRKKKKFELKQIIKRQKISNICSKFIDKLHRNNSKSQAVDYQGFEITQKQSFLQNEGFQINKIIDNSIALFSVLQITCLFFTYTMALVFPEVSDAPFIGSVQFFSIGFYLLEIMYNCLTVKANAGKKLQTFQQILHYYFKTNMLIDLLSLLILLIDCNSSIAAMQYFRLFIVTKLPQCFEKMEKLQAFFIKNYYNEQYWLLIKVILFNFCFAHLLAIILTSMASINSQMNWQTVKGIDKSDWFERYTWAYYWGTTMMLTIGFGDIVATTYQEALCLIVIEIFSVMCLAYNINSVGTLISNIRSQDIEKGKNYKTFKQLSDKYELSSDLEWKINHYIEESVNIRKKFNLEEENCLLQKLPLDLKKEYLKQSNRSIFYNLTFFGNLVDKTMYAFAEHIEMSISHPQQTLRRMDAEYNLLILRQGEIGFTAKKRNCSFNDRIIDRVKVTDVKKPFLLGLEFLTRQRPTYQIKSLEYSVIYYLQYEDLIKYLKESQMDYHHFCFLRDKNKTIIDEFEVYPCQYCPGKQHTKFTCPKLHFIPLKQLVIYKEQFKEKRAKNQRDRNPDNRILTDKINALINFKIINKITQEESAKKNERQKSSNPFLDQLSQLKRLQSEAKQDEMSGSSLEEHFLKFTSEVIRLEFNRFKILQNYEDQVWSLNCDKMKNYKDYFPENNPCNIEQKFKIEERLKFECINLESNRFILARSATLASFAKSPNASSCSFKADFSQQI